MSTRTTELTRTTRETDIRLALTLDGDGTASVDTGIGFLDHMLTALAFWSRFDLDLNCDGDLHVDDHHTAEDCALAFGEALDECLNDRRGIRRFGQAFAPMDESLARVAIDLSGRPFAVVNLGLQRNNIGQWATENIDHWFRSFAVASRATLHVDLVRGENDHHRTEAAFKGLALALRSAVEIQGDAVPSTKGSI